jgi:hypothetical protein
MGRDNTTPYFYSKKAEKKSHPEMYWMTLLAVFFSLEIGWRRLFSYWIS